MSIESIKKTNGLDTDQLQEQARDSKPKFNQDEMRRKVLEIFRTPSSNVNAEKLVYRATTSVLPNSLEQFDYETFRNRINFLDQK
jgi:hypothetical protein